MELLPLQSFLLLEGLYIHFAISTSLCLGYFLANLNHLKKKENFKMQSFIYLNIIAKNNNNDNNGNKSTKSICGDAEDRRIKDHEQKRLNLVTDIINSKENEKMIRTEVMKYVRLSNMQITRIHPQFQKSYLQKYKINKVSNDSISFVVVDIFKIIIFDRCRIDNSILW
ncbi:hypothetical protein RFI_26063 [Reticulomyxa filosa]|uniref:Uncharacterized protein n=1 Tax=Reticulomyxa filosa TaxID=46433 RepID=X6MCY5_RETFI|nr:hypothetical protein RFI_26063 [Reticulomyxa filosa]|eukprot:ETO11312.1 hypothetical protein RFI_26063 [Reticulomyxa filosa]